MTTGIMIFCATFLFFLGILRWQRERRDELRAMFLPPIAGHDSAGGRRNALAVISRFLQRYASLLFPAPDELEAASAILVRAGIEKTTAEELFALRYIAAGILAVSFFLLFFSGANFGFSAAMGLAGGFLGYLTPRLVVKARAEGRQRQAKKELLDYIELLSTATAAGLTIQDGIRRVAEYAPGVLSQEFRRAWTDVHGGVSRHEAFRGLAKRLDVEDITGFIDDIIHSEKQGTPVSQAMKRQAKRIRDKTKLMAVENAQKAAGKMMFPTIGLIFVPMIVLVLAPLAITLGQAFSY